MPPSIILTPDYDTKFRDRVLDEVRRDIPDIKAGIISTDRYASSARFVGVHDSVQGHRVFLLQRYFPRTIEVAGKTYPVMFRDSVTKDDACQMLDALKRAKAGEVWYCAPFLELRQDSQRDGRVSIGGKNVMDLLSVSGGHKLSGIQTFDLHCAQGTGFADVSVDNFSPIPCFLWYLRNNLFEGMFRDGSYKDKLGIIGGDAGHTEVNKAVARELGIPYVIIDKERNLHTLEGGAAEVGTVLNAQSLEGRIALTFDDIGDSFSTMANAAGVAKSLGATEVYACITHLQANAKKGITAEDKIRTAGLKVITTDTMEITDTYLRRNKDWLVAQLSIAPIIAEAIKRTILFDSVSAIFKDPTIVEGRLTRAYRDQRYIVETTRF
jgi:ribose-phosphate pyrophosphokinase